MKVFTILGKPFTSLAGQVHHTIQAKILMSVARHAATALGTYLVSQGLLSADPATTETFIGAILTLVGTFSGSAQKVAEHDPH